MTEQLHPGQQLGHYRLIRLLGQGGFAEVYLGEHIHLNTQVAVKVLHTRLAETDTQEFKNEAQMVARLLHPHIVRVLDFGVENGLPYLVMDYAPNGTLRNFLPKGQRIPLERVVECTKQIAEALQYAHDQRVVHRDVKPENMLLGNQYQVLLSDFGIALIQQSSRMQSTQNIAGTIAYMAPEQIQAHPGPASDQYALAITVYEWLCGTRPFQGTYTELAIKQCMVPPPPLRSFAPNIGPGVEQVILDALQKNPQQRFSTVRAFALALEQAALQSRMLPSSSTALFPPSAPPSQTLYQTTPAVSALPVTPGTGITSAPYPGITPLSTVTPPTLFSPPSTPQYMPSPAQSYTYGAFPTRVQPVFDPSHQLNRQTQPRPSRRMLLIAGAAGALTVGGITATYMITGAVRGSQQVIKQVISHGQAPGGVLGATQDQAELTYTGHSALVWIVRWSPDSQYIASGSFDGTVQVWTAVGGAMKLSVKSLVQPPISDDYAWSLDWSPRKDGTLAMSFVDGIIQVIDAKSASRVADLTTRVTHVPVLAWSPEERYLAVGGSDSIIRVYTYPDWQIVTTYQEHTNTINALSWSPDGSLIASGSEDTTVRLWNPLTGKTQLVYQGHSDRIAHLAWSYDNTRIISVSGDQTARVWRVPAGTTLYVYKAPSGAPLGEAAWSHDNGTIAIYNGNAAIDFLVPQSGHIKGSLSTGVIYSFSWSPDDSRIVTGSYNKVAQIWRV